MTTHSQVGQKCINRLKPLVQSNREVRKALRVLPYLFPLACVICHHHNLRDPLWILSVFIFARLR